MRLIKFIWKLFIRLFELFCLFIIIYGGLANYLGNKVVNADFTPDPNGIEIYILSNGVHTDIAVPTISQQKDWTKFLNPGSFQPPVHDGTTPEYIAFGWGDKALYEKVPTWPDLTLPIAINAMLIPSESAMHVSYFLNKPKTTPHSIPVKISPKQYEILIEAFIESFELKDGAPQSLNCCFYPHLRDQFYVSNRSYHILFTCNMWTNKLLKSAGIPTARWAPKQDYIMQHLRVRDLQNP